MNAHLDTHVAAHLAVGDLKKLSRAARSAAERYDLLISPIVRVELEYLYEVRRSPHRAGFVVFHLADSLNVLVCPLPFDRVARAACHESWTPDAFDRLIVGHARCAPDAYLITADETMRANYHRAVW